MQLSQQQKTLKRMNKWNNLTPQTAPQKSWKCTTGLLGNTNSSLFLSNHKGDKVEEGTKASLWKNLS